MYEVEAKVALDKTHYLSLKKELKKIAQFQGKQVKQDEYFGEVVQDYLRTREDKTGSVITVKKQALNNGVENNIEINIPIKSPRKVRLLFNKFGIQSLIRKKKYSLLFKNKKLTIELNKIESLGFFLEIEGVVRNKSDIKKVQKEVDNLFIKLGFTPSDYITESYPSMIVKKEKKK